MFNSQKKLEKYLTILIGTCVKNVLLFEDFFCRTF